MLKFPTAKATPQPSSKREGSTTKGRHSWFGRGLFLATAILAGSVLGVNIAYADQEAEADRNAEAASTRALAAQWWQFVLSIPKSVNPLTDETGQNCMVGQRGDVWFLGGVLNASGTATRACKIPEGRTLFFPIINSVGVNTPGACGQGTEVLSLADLRKMNNDAIDSVTTKSATLDQESLNIRRETSKIFAIALPQDNLFNDVSSPCPSDVYSPTVDAGYYVKLKGLKAGSHVLDITGSNPSFSLHIVYNLEIVQLNLE